MDTELAKFEGGRCCMVQEQVTCALAGVAFRHGDVLLVEANYGSSDATTSGEVPEVRMYTENGMMHWEMTKFDDRIPYQALAQQIIVLTDRICKIFSSPADIEWVFDGKITYIVQTRPVTTPIDFEAFVGSR